MNLSNYRSSARKSTLFISSILWGLALTGVFKEGIFLIISLYATLFLALVLFLTLIVNIFARDHIHWVFLLLFVLYMFGFWGGLTSGFLTEYLDLYTYVQLSLILSAVYIIFLFIRPPKEVEIVQMHDDILDDEW